MSNTSRFFRFLKSLGANFSKNVVETTTGTSVEKRIYEWADARSALNELGMQMKPEHLAYLLSKDTILDDFIGRVEKMEDKFGVKLLTREGTIDEKFEPTAKLVDGYLRVSAIIKGRERVLGEYELPN